MNPSAPSYSPEERRRLTQNLYWTSTQISRGELRERPPTIQLLCDIHRRIFGGVRSFAGSYRRRGEGSEVLIFGSHHSVHRNDVEGQLKSTFAQVAQSITSFDQNPDDPDYERGQSA